METSLEETRIFQRAISPLAFQSNLVQIGNYWRGRRRCHRKGRSDRPRCSPCRRWDPTPRTLAPPRRDPPRPLPAGGTWPPPPATRPQRSSRELEREEWWEILLFFFREVSGWGLPGNRTGECRPRFSSLFAFTRWHLMPSNASEETRSAACILSLWTIYCSFSWHALPLSRIHVFVKRFSWKSPASSILSVLNSPINGGNIF